MTLQEFAPIFAALAIQLRFSDADEGTVRLYFEAMKDLEPEFCAMAAQRLAKVPQEQAWFPKTPEWRAAAQKVEFDRTEELRARLRKLPKPICLACDDTGWARDASDRVSRCTCTKLRRLEILGRRPMPQLTEGTADAG